MAQHIYFNGNAFVMESCNIVFRILGGLFCVVSSIAKSAFMKSYFLDIKLSTSISLVFEGFHVIGAWYAGFIGVYYQN